MSVGKSTTARLLRLLPSRWPQHPRVELVTTDGFLYPNAELARRGLMSRKGFPESYDRRALLRFVTEVKAGRAEVAAPVCDFIDFSVYVDAATADIRRWYVERFLRLRETAFRDPESYFRSYAELGEAVAVARAGSIWAETNGPNLERNIAPTRGRASLVLRKGPDHSVSGIRLRKV